MPSKKRRGVRGKAAPYFTSQLATPTLVGVANSIVRCLKELTELVMNSGCQPHPEAPSGHQRRVSFQAQADTWLITLSDIDIQNRPSSTQGPKPTPAIYRIVPAPPKASSGHQRRVYCLQLRLG